jgi:hypothetical protein
MFKSQTAEQSNGKPFDRTAKELKMRTLRLHFCQNAFSLNKAKHNYFKNLFDSILVTLDGTKCSCIQGRQIVYFQTKNPNVGIFLVSLEWKMLVYSLAVRNI